MRKGKKVVCGSQDGVLSLFDWKDISDISDRFPGHPQSVDALVGVTDELLVSGSSDGLIRVLSVLPNALLGVVGEHSEFPVERLALSPSRAWLASASHDTSVKLWDVSHLGEEDGAAGGGEPAGSGGGGRAGGGEDSDEEEPPRAEEQSKKRRKKGKGAKGPPDSRQAFFADLQ